MTENCFQNIMPDSLTGAILAVEGVKDSAVILNGPTGCKFYHSAVSDNQFPRGLSFDPLSYPDMFYFGQPRVPCTYLDGHDYVYGAGDKLEVILREIRNREFGLVAVVNSPGAALIGDDLNHFLEKELAGVPSFSMESTGLSGRFGDGFQRAAVNILEAADCGGSDTVPRTVNLAGISIYNRFFEGDLLAIKRLLALCGIDVVSVLCAAEKMENIRNSRRASLNVVLYPEYGLDIVQWMNRKYSTPWLMPEYGLPVGFEAAEKFFCDICGYLDADPSPAVEEIRKARARSYLYLSRFSSLTGYPGGATFAVSGESSLVYSLSRWLIDYLGMIPVSVCPSEDDCAGFNKKIEALLEEKGVSASFRVPPEDTDAQLVFSDGNTIAGQRSMNKKSAGIEIMLPSMGYINVLPRGLMGPEGGLMLIEQIINGLQFL